MVTESDCIRGIMGGGEDVHRNLLLLKDSETIRTEAQLEMIELLIETHSKFLEFGTKAIMKVLNIGQKDS